MSVLVLRDGIDDISEWTCCILGRDCNITIRVINGVVYHTEDVDSFVSRQEDGGCIDDRQTALDCMLAVRTDEVHDALGVENNAPALAKKPMYPRRNLKRLNGPVW